MRVNSKGASWAWVESGREVRESTRAAARILREIIAKS